MLVIETEIVLYWIMVFTTYSNFFTFTIFTNKGCEEIVSSVWHVI